MCTNLLTKFHHQIMICKGFDDKAQKLVTTYLQDIIVVHP